MAKSKDRGRGNIDQDEAFLQWMEKNQVLEVLDPKESEELPFAAKLRFNGDADDEGSPWQIPPPGKRCAGRSFVRDKDGDYVIDESGKRLTRPCYIWPILGGKVCIKHGGGVHRVKAAALERLVSALDAASGELIKIAMDQEVDPKVRVQAINSIMDRTGVRTGVEVDIRDPGYVDVLRDAFKHEGKKALQKKEAQED